MGEIAEYALDVLMDRRLFFVWPVALFVLGAAISGGIAWHALQDD